MTLIAITDAQVVAIVQMVVPFVAIAISICALLASIYARRESIRPVLVFVRRENQWGVWHLENVGKGPALNIVVRERSPKKWFVPVRIYPIPAGGMVKLDFYKNFLEFEGWFTDAEGRNYHVHCTEHHSVVKRTRSRCPITSDIISEQEARHDYTGHVTKFQQKMKQEQPQ